MYMYEVSQKFNRPYLYKDSGNFFYAELVYQYLDTGSNNNTGKGSSGMVSVARSQIGNSGGQPYWSWYVTLDE